MTKAYTYLGGLLFLIGVAAYRKIAFRSDHRSLAVTTLLVFSAIWLVSCRGGIESRYFLSAVLISLPWTALGLLTISRTLFAWTKRQITWTQGRRRAMIAGLAGVLLIPASFERHVSLPKFWYGQTALGQWIAADYGPGKSIVANILDIRMIQYHAQSRFVEAFSVKKAETSGLPVWMTTTPPDFVVIWLNPSKDATPFETFARTLTERSDLGYCRVPKEELPTGCRDVIVLARVKSKTAASDALASQMTESVKR